MPKALERQLMKEGRAKGFTGERLNAYVYGTLRKTGWVPEREKKHKKGKTILGGRH